MVYSTTLECVQFSPKNILKSLLETELSDFEVFPKFYSSGVVPLEASNGVAGAEERKWTIYGQMRNEKNFQVQICR